MGVDTIGFINEEVTIERLVHVAKEKFPDSTITLNTPTLAKDFYFIEGFKDEVATFERSVMVYKDQALNEQFQTDGTVFSVSMLGNATDIMRALVEEFGGGILENDCSDDPWVVIPKNPMIDWTAYYQTVDNEQKETRKRELENRRAQIENELATIASELSQIEGTL